MSTTSLSSCDHGEYCQCMFQDSYGRIYQPGPPTPFFNTMGQPLVYYAQLQPQDSRAPKREGNKNCFVKAFKWYTQDLHETRNQKKIVPQDLTGFADWLDSKYGEYRTESVAQRSAQPSQPASTIGTTSCPPCPPSTIRRYPRMRSPWNKRKSSSKNAGDLSSKSKSPTASCQFILHPQDLTRPASACYQTPPSCPNKSNTFMVSNETIGTKKSVVKSRSMTSICHENVTRNCIDIITVQEGPKNVSPASGGQKSKIDKKVEPQTKQDISTVEEIQQKSLITPSIEPCKVVQQICGQNCRAKQNFQNLEHIQRVPSKSQRTETRSDETCLFMQEYKLGPEQSPKLYEINCLPKEEFKTSSRTQQNNIIPNDQIKFCTLAQKVKSHARHRLCDQTCTAKEKCDFLLSVKSCELETCEECSKIIRECSLVRKEREGRGIYRAQKILTEQEGAIEVETDRFVSTSQRINTPRDRDLLTKDKYVGQMVPVTSDKSELLCNQNCTAKQINNIHDSYLTQTQSTVSADKNNTRGAPAKLSKKLKVDNECQCPEEKSVEIDIRPRAMPSTTASPKPTCNSIGVESIPPVIEQAQPSLRTIQPYTQSKTKPAASYFSKKMQKSNEDVSCQCPKEGTRQYDTSRPLYRSPEVTTKSYVSCYPKKVNNVKVDVSSQCSENVMKQSDCSCVSDRRPQANTNLFNLCAQKKNTEMRQMIEVSCECFEQHVLKFDKSCQYRRNDIEASVNTICICSKPVLPTVRNMQIRKLTPCIPACRSDSVQTSDHSIRLDKRDVHDYALFMKIVCADKLNG